MGGFRMTRLVRISLLIAVAIGFHPFVGKSVAAESSAEQLYAKLAKVPADQRTKQLEDGARKEGKLNFVHTWRGKIARDHVALFEKRCPFVKVEMGDIGSQDAAERFIAEETAGRHLTDILTLGVPDMAGIFKQKFVAPYPNPARKRSFKHKQNVIQPGQRLTPLVLGRNW